MHLENHLYQFAVFLKNQYPDLPYSLLQQFNFGDITIKSEDAATELESEIEPDEKDQPAPT